MKPEPDSSGFRKAVERAKRDYAERGGRGSGTVTIPARRPLGK